MKTQLLTKIHDHSAQVAIISLHFDRLSTGDRLSTSDELSTSIGLGDGGLQPAVTYAAVEIGSGSASG